VHPALVVGLVVLGLLGTVVAVLAVDDGEDAVSAQSPSSLVADRPSTTTAPRPTITTPIPTTTTPQVTAAPTTSSTPGTDAGQVPSACAPVRDLTIEQQAHLVVMVGIDGSSIAPAEMLTAGSTPLGGVFIGGDATRILSDGSLARLVERTHSLVAVDDEGGRVQRIDHLVGPLPSAAQMGSMSVEQVRLLGSARGRQLRSRGVRVDFAPVVDMVDASTGGVIGDRSFGTDPRAVIDRAGAFADGLRSSGVTPTLKHFPGHGRAQGDSHRGVVSTPSLSELERSDLLPYSELAGPDAGRTWVMMGHLDVPGLTEADRPASLSPAAHRYLRERIGFKGLIVTDELGGMQAVRSRYGVGQAAAMAIEAGSDLVLFARTDQADPAARAIMAAVRNGSLPASRLAEAATRVREAQGC